MKLSKNLTLEEVIRSTTAKRLGIDNLPTTEHLQNLRSLAQNIYEPLRQKFRKRIFVSSGYRSQELNKNTPGSSSTSQHSLGEALDLDQDSLNNGVTNKMIFNHIKDFMSYDQLIMEFPDDKGNPSWVHVSWKSKGVQRNQCLISIRENGRVRYLPYTTENYRKICPNG